MSDIYGAPATKGAAVTPGDSTTVNFRGLYVGAGGNVAVVFKDDTTDTAVTLVGVVTGSVLPIAVKKVMSTNTTATSIVGLA